MDITRWLMKENIDIESVEFLIDAGKSGTTARRPQFDILYDDLRADNIEFIIVQTDDRIMRNVRETINFMSELQKHKNTRLIILNGYMDYSSATGKFITNNKASANQFWSDKTSEDTINRTKAAAEKGRYAKPGCPLGFIKDTKTMKLSLDMINYEGYQQIGQMIASNEYSFNGMFAYLKVNEIVAINWTIEKLRSLLRNPISNGTFENKKQGYRFENHSPKLFDDLLWHRIQIAMDRRKNVKRYDYIFKHKVKCERCGVWCTHSSTIRPYRVYLYYVCPKCGGRINEKKILEGTKESIEKFYINQENGKYKNKIKKKINQISLVLNNLHEEFLSGIIDETKYQKSRETLIDHRMELNDDLANLQIEEQSYSYKNWSYYLKFTIVKELIEYIEVNFDTGNMLVKEHKKKE